ncbi:MAG TPA: hypothetical protein DCS93_16130 [Microscillaceae bacterium]|nr:hypothetical protein [Microscillaceae bacterium]
MPSSIQRGNDQDANQSSQSPEIVQKKESTGPRLGQKSAIQAKQKPIQAKQKPVQAKHQTIQAKQSPIQRNSQKGTVQRNSPKGDDLKERMSAHYKVDLSGYQEHPNSSFPGTVGADATIQGKDIHYGPGKFTEQNRKHELGHAIDNTLNGPPKGDTVINGKNIDTTREKAAEKIENTPLPKSIEGEATTQMKKTGETSPVQTKTSQNTQGEVIQGYIKPELTGHKKRSMKRKHTERIIKRFALNAISLYQKLDTALSTDNLVLAETNKLSKGITEFTKIANNPSLVDLGPKMPYDKVKNDPKLENDLPLELDDYTNWVNTISGSKEFYGLGALNDPSDALSQANDAVMYEEIQESLGTDSQNVGKATRALLAQMAPEVLREAEIACGTKGVPVVHRETLIELEGGTELDRPDSKSFREIPHKKPGMLDFGTDHYDYEFWTESQWTTAPFPKARNLEELTQNIKGSDVKQGGLGLCYMYAALATLADVNPSFIKSMFTHLDRRTATVRLFTSSGKPTYITVNRTQVVGKNSKDKRVVDNFKSREWVRLISKAYVTAGFTGSKSEEVPDTKIGGHLKKKGIKTGDGSLGSDVGMGHLTGQQKNYETPSWVYISDDNVQTIKEALDQGKAVTCCFMNITNLIGWNNDDSLESGHVYTVVGYRGNNFIIRNPWGRTVPKQTDDGGGNVSNMEYNLKETDKSDDTDGRFVLTKDQFKKEASWVTINHF